MQLKPLPFGNPPLSLVTLLFFDPDIVVSQRVSTMKQHKRLPYQIQEPLLNVIAEIMSFEMIWNAINELFW